MWSKEQIDVLDEGLKQEEVEELEKIEEVEELEKIEEGYIPQSQDREEYSPNRNYDYDPQSN